MARFPEPPVPTRASWLALPPEPWKNGGGVTRTLAVDPAGRWRVSIADIGRDGPYSRFPGYDRVSVVLSGEGVTLQGEGVAVPLQPSEPAVFGGDAALQSTLVGGPVRVLNLFVLRGEAVAQVACTGVSPGHCEAGFLPEAAVGPREVTRLVVAADAGQAGGPPAKQAAPGAGEYLLTRRVEGPGVATPRVATPGVATPTATHAWALASGSGFAVVLDIAVLAGGPN